MDLDVGSITPVLKRFKIIGFVARNRSKINECVVIISLTAVGQHLQDEIAVVQENVALQTALCDEDFTLLKQTLNHLTEK